MDKGIETLLRYNITFVKIKKDERWKFKNVTSLEKLTAAGVISRAFSDRKPTASGRQRARSRRPIADIVGEQR